MPRPRRGSEQAIDPRRAPIRWSTSWKAWSQRGTARCATHLNRPLFGKTGTTSGPTNVWFVGGTPDLIGGLYLGYDQPRPLGGYAQGATIAAPVFNQFAEVALEGPAQDAVPRRARASAWSGSIAARASGCTADARRQRHQGAVIWEAFKPESEPRRTGRIVRDPVAERGRTIVRSDSDFLAKAGGIY